MAYCDRDDFDIPERKLVQLCDDEALAVGSTTLAAAEALNSAITKRIDAAIERADSKINSYLRAQYDVPLETVPDTVKRLSVDLTMFYLHGRRDSEFPMPDSVYRRNKDAIEELEGINSARIDLGIDPPPAESSKVAVIGTQAEQLFTQDSLKDV